MFEMNLIRENKLLKFILKLPLSRLAFYSIAALYILLRILFVFSSKVGYEVGEEDNIWNLLNLLDGKTIYSEPKNAPYEIFLYPPIAQLFYGGVLKIFMIRDLYTVSVTLRGLSFAFNLATIWQIRKFLLIHSKVINIQFINWFSLMGLATLNHLNWTLRVDAMAIFISVFIVLLSINYFTNHFEIKRIILLSLLINLGVFIKQDAIQFIVILPATLTIIRRYRQAILLFSFSIIFLCLGYLISNFIWGDNFHNSVIGGVSNPMSITNAFDVVNRYFQLYSVLPISILVAVLYSILWINDTRISIAAIITFGLFLFACVTSMKLGAWVNYFSTFSLIGILLLGLTLQLKYKKIIIISITIFLGYFISGYVYHYLTKGISFDLVELNSKKVLSEKIRHMTPANSLFYTSDDILELYLHDVTIFPNQVFYNGMCTYKHNLNKEIIKKIVLINTNNSFDYVENQILGLSKENTVKLNIQDNVFMYRPID